MSAIDTAVILAAGLGSRLGDLTATRPKGFLELGGVSLVERSCRSLVAHGIKTIIIGTGYKSEIYDAFAAEFDAAIVECVRNPKYEETGSMYTLYNLRQKLPNSFLLLESDLLYEPRALEAVLRCPENDLMLLSGPTVSGDEVHVQADNQGLLVNLSKNPEMLSRVDGELVGILRLSKVTLDAMCVAMEKRLEDHPAMDYEHALVEVARSRPIAVLRLDDLIWCEIDDHHHLQRAKVRILPRIDDT